MAKYWASVSVNYEYYTEDINAETAEEAKDKAYDIAKKLMTPCNPQLRPFGINVVAVGQISNETEEKH